MTHPRPKRRTMNIPESQRYTEQVKLRLDPEVAARLRGIAHAWGETLGEVVEAALDALDGKGRGR
jgi:hypothetical protein